jgi:hypothetical protein
LKTGEQPVRAAIPELMGESRQRGWRTADRASRRV